LIYKIVFPSISTFETPPCVSPQPSKSGDSTRLTGVRESAPQ
jgi:hypothetical protein